jgi:hypothetical protein
VTFLQSWGIGTEDVRLGPDRGAPESLRRPLGTPPGPIAGGPAYTPRPPMSRPTSQLEIDSLVREVSRKLDFRFTAVRLPPCALCWLYTHSSPFTITPWAAGLQIHCSTPTTRRPLLALHSLGSWASMVRLRYRFSVVRPEVCHSSPAHSFVHRSP